MRCPNCQSKQLVENGFNALGKQVYRCKECNRQFVLNPAKEPISNKSSVPSKNSDDLLPEQLDQEQTTENQTAVDWHLSQSKSKRKIILLVTIMTISGLFSTAWFVWPCYFLWGCAGQEPNPLSTSIEIFVEI